MTITVTATVNVPNCTISAESDLPGTAQMSWGKTGEPLVADPNTIEDIEPDANNKYQFEWVISDISGLVDINYSAAVQIDLDIGTVDWLQPQTEEAANTIVEFGDNLEPVLGNVSTICARIISRGYSIPEEWSELRRVLNTIIVRGRTVTLDANSRTFSVQRV